MEAFHLAPATLQMVSLARPDLILLTLGRQYFAAKSLPMRHQLATLCDQLGPGIGGASGIAVDVDQGELADFFRLGVFLSPGAECCSKAVLCDLVAHTLKYLCQGHT